MNIRDLPPVERRINVPEGRRVAVIVNGFEHQPIYVTVTDGIVNTWREW